MAMKQRETLDVDGLGCMPIFSLAAIEEAKAVGVGYYVFSGEEMRAAIDLAEAMGVTLTEALAECVRLVRMHGPRGFLDLAGHRTH